MVVTDLQLAWNAATQLHDGERVFVGIGAPAIAAMIARRSHAPCISMLFESGVDCADPQRVPASTGSHEVASGAALHGSMLDAFSQLQSGRIDVGVLSAAQVDPAGNLNSTVIGSYEQPRVRLPGSGGAHDIAALARRVLVVMPHDPRRLVDQVDFVTCRGWDAARLRRVGGVLRRGPVAMTTERGLFTLQGAELTLSAVTAGGSASWALEGLSWVGESEVRELPPLPSDAHTRFDFDAPEGSR